MGVPTDCKVVYAQDFAPGDGNLDDDNGHGTNVAGIVLGVAPGAKILALDVFTGESASDTDILAAINWVIANKATYNIVAMNLSLGGDKFTSPETNGPYNPAVNQARAAGILTIAAAGNDGFTNALMEPAATSGVVSVGAVYDSTMGSFNWEDCTDITSAADKVICFSNSAPFLTMLAPGSEILAAGITMDGTSQATPHVAGAVAVLRAAFPNETLDQTVARLTNGVMVTDSKNNITKPRLDLQKALSLSTAPSLYFPHVATSLPWQTEIAIINTSKQSVTGTLSALSNAGQLIETKAVTLSARGRRQIVVANEFANHTNIGYIVFDTNSAAVQGYTKFYQEGVYRAAIPAVKEVNNSNIYISHIASNAQWWTGISLVNTTSATKDLTITFNNGWSIPYTLNANEHKAFTIENLFNNQPQPDIQSAVITNANGVIGLDLFGSIGSGNQLDGILLTDDTASTIYYPHVASNSTWWTGIVAYNPSDSAGTITITPYNTQGTPLSPTTRPIAGKEKYVGVVSNLGLPAQTEWFKIDSTQPLTGFELFGTYDGKQLAAYSGSGAKTGVFAKIEKNGWTGIAFVNMEADAASVTLTAYNDNGTAVATQVLPVDGHAKVVNLAENIFSQNIIGATYIAYSSDKNVVGFQLNGSSDGTMLDGLPGLPCGDPTSVVCSYSISPTSNSFTSSGGTGSVGVTAQSGCSWTASINSSWITITAGSSGSGNGTVSYSVSANMSTVSRSGTMTIAGKTFTINQSGASNNVNYNNTYLLKGTWTFFYTIINIYSNTYVLDSMDPTPDSSGNYHIFGTGIYGDSVVGCYSSALGSWDVLDPGTIIDRFFVFKTDGTNVLPGGCYYQISHPSETWSRCYPLSGYKTNLTSSTAKEVGKAGNYSPTKNEEAEKKANQAVFSEPDESVKNMYLMLKNAAGK
jgi:hypothetical protein